MQSAFAIVSCVLIVYMVYIHCFKGEYMMNSAVKEEDSSESKENTEELYDKIMISLLVCTAISMIIASL